MKATAFVIAVLIIVFTAPVHAQWEKTAGPNLPSIHNIVEHNGTLFAAAWRGSHYKSLYRSTNNGRLWEAITDPVLEGYVTGLSEFQGAIYVTTHHGLAKSTDAGSTWELLIGLPDSYVAGLGISGDRIYTAVNYMCMYSDDGGKNWNEWMAAPTSISSASSMVLLADTLLLETFGSRIEAFWPGGPMTSNNRIHSLAMNDMVLLGETLYVASEDGLLRTTSSFRNWENAGLQGENLMELTCDGQRMATINAEGRIFIADLNDLFWEEIPLEMDPGPSGGLRILELSLTETSLFLCVDYAGIMRYDFAAQEWSEASNGISTAVIWQMENIGKTLFAACGPGGMHRSTDYGDTWEPIHNWFNDKEIYSLATYNNTLYAVSASGAIMASTDLGDTWVYLTNATMAIPDFERGSVNKHALVVDEDHIYVAAGYRLCYSFDGGATWNYKDIGARTIKKKEGKLYIGANKGLYTSTDNGVSWSLSEPIKPQPGQCGHLSNRIAPFDVNGDLIIGGSEVMFITTDAGYFWIQHTPISYGTIIYLRAVEYLGGAWLAAYSGGEVYRGRDDGLGWLPFGEGLIERVDVSDFHVVGNYVFASDHQSGLWRRHLTEIVAVDEPASPSSLTLAQNYPNPFSGATTISYSLPSAEYVTLTVTNALGQEVARLVEARMEAGAHNVPFNTTGLVPGMYFYTLRSGNATVTKSMLVTKQE